MATQVYRVAEVRTATGSPVARLQAVDEDGHELRLELPVALVGRAEPGHVLVLNWSLHALPEPLAPAPERPPVAAAPSSPAAAGPRAVDDAFMDLMSRVRRGPTAAPQITTTSPASQSRGEPEINDEFNTLLGRAPGKGTTDGR